MSAEVYALTTGLSVLQLLLFVLVGAFLSRFPKVDQLLSDVVVKKRRCRGW